MVKLAEKPVDIIKKCRCYTICPPEDEHNSARNM